MKYKLEEKYKLIKEVVIKSSSKNPVEIVKTLMNKDFVDMHGPEHHFLDGASFLVAYKNAGGTIDLDNALEALAERTIKMPGAMCGYWGVCGAVTSLGAALSIINNITPLSCISYYKDNMEFTSFVIKQMSKIGGPRCCKRNAFISIGFGIKFVKEKYGISMDIGDIICDFSLFNKQCIGIKCPFYRGEK